jgi:hypothetical protein
MLSEDEAVTLAVLLEELAAIHQPDPLGVRALQAAALLRYRAAARQGQEPRASPTGPTARRETGDVRDDQAGTRDDEAGQRDRRAGQRDDQAAERDRQADSADQEGRAGEQRIRDLLWDAELRDRVAAAYVGPQRPPAGDDRREQWLVDREIAETDRARDQEDRQAVRELLSQLHANREAARHGREASRQDRAASRQDRRAAQADRQDADRDRQAARVDRDQTVIESEEQDPGRA